ncbi:MAG: hypothetical protein JO372_07200 [Solirubrobacterales bacterium]|nr:hypothetical protein [Solirubrobacterales bacterium]
MLRSWPKHYRVWPDAYTRQLKAGAILERMQARLPDHPGVAQYLIRTYRHPLPPGLKCGKSS